MKAVDLKQTLFTLIGTLLHESRKYLDEQLKPFGLSRNEWIILAMLRANPNGVTKSYVKSYIGIEKSYLTKILNKLENKKFIIREVCKDDKRNKLIKANPKASVKIKKIFQIIIDHNNEIHMDLNKEQLTIIHEGLNCIATRLSAIKNHNIKE